MINFKGVRLVTQTQYNELLTKGRITVDGTDYVFDEDWLYVTPTTLQPPIISDVPPTTATVAQIGVFYLDTSSHKTYVCVAIDERDDGSTVYTWEDLAVVSGVSSENFDKLINNQIQIQINPSSHGLSFGGASAGYDGIGMGQYASATADAIAIGYTANGQSGGVAIGRAAKAPSDSVAIGNGAKITSLQGIQIGKGTNPTAKTVQIFDKNIYNYETDTLTVNNIQNSAGGFVAGLNAVSESGGIAIGENAAVVKGGIGIAIGKDAKSNTVGAIQLGGGKNLKPNTLQISNDNIYNHSTHTLTVQNIELNGVDINAKFESLGSAYITDVVDAEDPLVSKFDGILSLTETQYADLKNNGALSIGDINLTYNDSLLYITPDELHDLTLTGSDVLISDDVFNEHVQILVEFETDSIHAGFDCVLHPYDEAICFVTYSVLVNGQPNFGTAYLDESGCVVINVPSGLTFTNIHAKFKIL